MAWVSMLVAGTIAVLAIAGACLPDLAPIGDEDAQAQVPIPILTGCGDGVIDTLDDGGGESCDPGDAQSPGCENCQFVCSGGIDDAGHCYFFADNTTRYVDAVNACKAANAHVVTFASAREAAFASSLAKSTGHDAGYWVGLSVKAELGDEYGPTNVSEPGWPHSGKTCTGCFSVGADDTGRFAVHPSADGGKTDCLVAENSTWLQVPCNTGETPFTTLCEREPVGERLYFCGGPNCTTIPATAGSKRYVIPTTTTTAEEATAQCASFSSTLVVLETREEREQLVREIVGRYARPNEALTVWIGLSLSDAGVWTWEDGVVADGTTRPVPWASSQPAGPGVGRAFLRIDGQFDTQLAQSEDDAGARELRVVVCQRR